MKYRRLSTLLLVMALALSAAPVSNARDTDGLVFQIKGAANTVYLAGSIHMLRAEDFPLPDSFDAAYDNADVLIMELDLDDLDPIEQSKVIRNMAMAPEGSSLRLLMGEQAWETANDLADQEGINLRRMNEVRPWFAAITAVQMKLLQLGYRQDYGIEGHFVARAAEDNKAISGLETLEQQIGFLAMNDNDKQVEFLLMSLAEISAMAGELEAMIEFWKAGDGDGLYAILEASFDDYPGLFEVLIEQRNRNWMGPLTEVLDNGQQDYMVIVGALHLLGPSGVIELLRQRGYAVTSL